MSDDSNRAAKVASAKKLLKQYQKKNKEIARSLASSNSSSQHNLLYDNETLHKEFVNDELIKTNTDIDPIVNQIWHNNEITSNGQPSNSRIPFQNPFTAENYNVNYNTIEANNILPHENVYSISNPHLHDINQYTCQTNNIMPLNNESAIIQENVQKNSDLENLLKSEYKKNAELLETLKENELLIENLKKDLNQATEFKDKNLKQQISESEEKLLFQMKSMEILISENFDLKKKLDTLQDEHKEKTELCNELTARLKASRNHVSKLEKDISETLEARLQHNDILKRLEKNLQVNEIQTNTFKKELDETKAELRDTKSCLESANSELFTLKKQIEEKDSQLSLIQIRIQQLGGGPDDGAHLINETENLKEELNKLTIKFNEVINEKEQTNHQYQQYISSLQTQIEDISSKLNVVTEEKINLELRKEDLIHHISNLEKQIQHPNSSYSKDSNDKLSSLIKELNATKQLVDNLRTTIEEEAQSYKKVKEELIEYKNREAELKMKLERIENDIPDAKLLQAAMESDKVAASRAIQQNTVLKEQLTEIQAVMIKLSNDKLELTDELNNKDKNILELNEKLSKYVENISKNSEENNIGQHEHSHDQHCHEHSVVFDSCTQTTYHDVDINPETPVSVEAMVMLEDRFKRTMNDLADLHDEKQKLEHLVMQLQGETETIGDYISLYRNQRHVLQKRVQEKEELLNYLEKEKNVLREKLNLIHQLLTSLTDGNLNSVDRKDEIISKIINLLMEIANSNLMAEKLIIKKTDKEVLSTNDTSSNFHPCPVCSGRLETV